MIQHFGLGTATSVSTIEVRWPNGKVQTFPGVTSNQIITLTEDAAAPKMTFFPLDGATGVNIKDKIRITMDEPATGSGSKIHQGIQSVGSQLVLL